MTKHFNKKSLLERRRQLRMKMTEAETMLWGQIRRKQQNIRFLRQYSVDGYVLDFYAPELKLAIELDGEIHFNREQIAYDKYRQAYLEEFGITVLRFNNNKVLENMDEVLDCIKAIIEKLGNPS